MSLHAMSIIGGVLAWYDSNLPFPHAHLNPEWPVPGDDGE